MRDATWSSPMFASALSSYQPVRTLGWTRPHQLRLALFRRPELDIQDAGPVDRLGGAGRASAGCATLRSAKRTPTDSAEINGKRKMS